MTPGFRSASYRENWRVWVDFNQDGVFGANESVLTGSSRKPVPGYIHVPPNAALGLTRMRVSMRWGGIPAPCGVMRWGEVEDYTVNISN